MTENLGNLRRTERGFEIITFHDRYNQACSLQQSSLAFEAAIWLGIAGNRMHLTESQVMNLAERLNAWLLSGDHSFMFYGESVEDSPTQVEDKKEEPVIFPEFVNAPLWRRLLIALFPAKHFTPN